MIKLIPYLKAIIFLLCLLPLFLLVNSALSGDIIDPIEEITNPTGRWALRFLLITLTISPLAKMTKLGYLIRLRRMLGLFVFFYAVLHFSIWLIDQQFSLMIILEDIVKRSYITLGFLAFLLLIPLAITSTNGWVKRLGGRGWRKLHRLVYLIAILACVHFYWQSKSDMAYEPFVYAIILSVLLAYRLVRKYQKT